MTYPSMFFKSLFTSLLCESSSSMFFASSIMSAPSMNSDSFSVSVSDRYSLASCSCFLSYSAFIFSSMLWLAFLTYATLCLISPFSASVISSLCS